jgi:hypothetical protein
MREYRGPKGVGGWVDRMQSDCEAESEILTLLHVFGCGQQSLALARAFVSNVREDSQNQSTALPIHSLVCG